MHSNLHYVILAEFDIDKGSTIKYQYPQNTGISETILADWMLPSGAHSREIDWTVFFLRSEEIFLKTKNPQKSVLSEIQKTIESFSISAKCFHFNEKNKDWFPFNNTEKSQMIYIKQKEQHFYIEIESVIYDSENEIVINKNTQIIKLYQKMEFVLLEKLFVSFYQENEAEDAIGILFENLDDLELFREIIDKILAYIKNIKMEEKSDFLEKSEEIEWPNKRLYCLNLVRTQMDDRVRRGAVCKSMAICTSHSWFYRFKSLLLLALDKYFSDPTPKILEDLYKAVVEMDVSPLWRISPIQKKILYSLRKIDQFKALKTEHQTKNYFQAKVKWGNVKVNIRVPLDLNSSEITNTSITNLLKTYSNQIITLYNAVLNEKRIIFLGHNQTAEVVCNQVLSACMLVSPPLPNVLDRAYPYVNLTSLEFLSKKGYIAGAMNPIFEQRKEWWDVLCDISTGNIVLSSSYEKELAELDPDENIYSFDTDFSFEVQVARKLDYTEDYVRHLFRAQTQKLIDLASSENASDNENKNQSIISTQSFILYHNNLLNEIKNSLFKDKLIIIKDAISDLKTKKHKNAKIGCILKELLILICDKKRIKEFISLFSLSDNGIYCIAICLFSKDSTIKKFACELLTRIYQIDEGKELIEDLNYFLLDHFLKLKDNKNN